MYRLCTDFVQAVYRLCTGCVQTVYRTMFLKFTRDYMNICAKDGMFIYPVVMLMVLYRYNYTADSVRANYIKKKNNIINVEIQMFAVVK